MTVRRFVAVCGLVVMWGGMLTSQAWAKKFTFDTAPVKQGRIFVDGKFVGISPVTVDFSVPKNGSLKARAEKDGALGLWITEFSKDQKETVLIRLEEDESWKQTIESDVANKWLTIDPSLSSNRTLDEAASWKKIVSIVTDNFSDIEQLDRESFYLRTAWRVRRYAYSVVRNRLIIKRGVSTDLTLRIELESQVYRSNSPVGSLSVRDDLFQEHSRIYSADQDTIRHLRDQL